MNKQEAIAKLRIPEEYYAGYGEKFISNSHLSILLSDPAAYGTTKTQGTYQMTVGSLLHDMMEESITGAKDLVSKYEVVNEFREVISYKENEVTEDEFKDCVKWAEAYRNNKTVLTLLKGEIVAEEPLIGEIDGVPFKAKCDIINHDRKIIGDWKTTGKTIASFGGYGFGTYNYDSAYYIYKELALQTYGEEYDMVFLPVSKKANKFTGSNDVGVFFPTLSQWYDGKRKVELAIKNYKLFVNK